MSTQEVVAALVPAQSAEAVSLRSVSDTRPGIIRKRQGKQFPYPTRMATMTFGLTDRNEFAFKR